MLTQRSFIKWANENLVVLIAHNELGHEPIEKAGYDGEPVDACPLYPGMTCRQHCDASVDIDAPRDDDLTKVPFIELCPNSWLVPPVGEPEQIPETDQFVAGKVKARAEAMQKRLGTSLSADTYRNILNIFTEAEAAFDDDAWRKALERYAGIATLAKEPPASLRRLLDGRCAAIEEFVRYAYDDAVEAQARDAGKRAESVAAVRALLAAIDVPVYGVHLPLRAEMQAWLAEHAPTTPGGK